jgi:hypothetical protein
MDFHKELYFDDLHTFWQYAMGESEAVYLASRREGARVVEWSGGLTWEEAKRMALSGWGDIIPEIEKYRAVITPIITDKVLRPRQVYAVAGYSVDVGSFLANDPECFINREYEERNYPGKVFKIVCSVSHSSGISKNVIINRGAIICALIDAIEYAGHRVEVVCNNASAAYNDENSLKGQQKEDGWFEVSVLIKKATQPLDMSDLAYCLAHPSMLRRIMFSAAEIEGWSDVSREYGYPAEATDKGDLYVKELFYGEFANESEAVSDVKVIDWVLTQLRKLGVDIETDHQIET